jgi:hypothetical protein
MSSWSLYLTIPKSCVTDELEKFYGYTSTTRYKVPLEAYIENRYGKVLGGSFDIEVSKESFAHETGTTVLLPLIDHMSPEEALADILQEELGISSETTEPDWAYRIEMPHVAELVRQVAAAQTRIARDKALVDQLHDQISDINSFRRLLYSTGPELEAIVKRSLEQLGATVSPSKYAQEEYILEHDGQEFLMEVKGVAKSISLTHLRQLNDYLLKYEEDTGKACKGILFGNAWRNLPPEMRGGKDTPEFPDNVIKRAEQWGISLVSSKAFFPAFLNAAQAPESSNEVLTALTGSSGLAFPPNERTRAEASHDEDREDSSRSVAGSAHRGRKKARRGSTG